MGLAQIGIKPWPGSATSRIWQKSGISARPKKETESRRNRITARSPSRNCFFLPQAVYCARRESNLDICLRRAAHYPLCYERKRRPEARDIILHPPPSERYFRVSQATVSTWSV